MALYSSETSLDCHRVRFVLAEKGINVEIVNISEDESAAADLAELNPYNEAPTLVDRDLALYDSRIIMEYLDERYPHPPLLPIDPVSRANTRLYLHRIEKDWYSLADEILAGGKGAAKARKELKEALLAAGPILAAKPWFMSDEYTLVDATIAPLLWRLPALGIEISGTGSRQLLDYAKRAFARECFAKSLTEQEKELRK